MARSSISLLVSICYLFTLTSTLSLPASPPGSSLTLTAANPRGNSALPSSNSSESKWYWASGDGSQIVPINGPEDIPKNITAPGKLPYYALSYFNYLGPPTPLPGLAKFLFKCESDLLDEVPASDLGILTPYPHGKYVCEPVFGGSIHITLVSNTRGWNMTYKDLNYLMAALFISEALQSVAQSFDFDFFEFFHSDETPSGEDFQRLVTGRYNNTFGGGDDVATSAQ